MDANSYQKIVHAVIWFGNKVALSERLKDGFHKNFWQNPGGKVEKNESLLNAVRRETLEETGVYLFDTDFELVDCYIYTERKLKTFLYAVKYPRIPFKMMLNTEPKKQSNWELFTVKQALKLKLMPSLRYYLENL